jgi:hypothetical protein
MKETMKDIELYGNPFLGLFPPVGNDYFFPGETSPANNNKNKSE